MKIKEVVIRETMSRINKRVEQIKHILNANPLGDIIQGRLKAQCILDENKGDYKKISALINPLATKEKKLFRLAKKQKKSGELITEQVKLENELCDLKNELFMMNRR